MARYRKIDVRIWNDKKFRDLSDNAKLAFLLVLTHPDTNQLGMIRARPMALAMDLGWQPDAMQDAISELSHLAMLMVDEKAGLIVAPNFLKYNPPNGPNAVKSWGGLIDLLPECDLRSETLIRVDAFIDGLSDGLKKAVPDDLKDAISDAKAMASDMASSIQEQEQEQDKNHNKHISVVMEKDAPAPVDVCDEFENPFLDEPPFNFEPDGQDFFAPIGQMIDESNLENNKAALDDPKHILTASQIVVLAGTLGVRLGHSADLDVFADRKTLTVGIVTDLITQFKAMQKPVGYLIGMLRNASANPDTVNGKKKEITSETMTDAQCRKFAQALAQRGRWCGANRIITYGKTAQQLEESIQKKLREPQVWETAKVELQNLGLIAKEA